MISTAPARRATAAETRGLLSATDRLGVSGIRASRPPLLLDHGFVRAQVKVADDCARAIGRGPAEASPSARAERRRMLELRLGRGELHRKLPEHLRVAHGACHT